MRSDSNGPKSSQPADIADAMNGTAQQSNPSVIVPRILMAEDNAINQRVGKLILQRAGFAIDVVQDGHEALQAHKERPYDLILMDCQMPIMDGFEACRQIRMLSGRQPVIVAVTANALLGERERCLDAGMDDYLSKPFQAEQLICVVQKWVGAARQTRT
jgi:two-component system, sensor histidine kinase and response regulator